MGKSAARTAGFFIGFLLHCGPVLPGWFIRGDVDTSGGISITDAVALFRVLFFGQAADCSWTPRTWTITAHSRSPTASISSTIFSAAVRPPGTGGLLQPLPA
jgi:hypothetical protein